MAVETPPPEIGAPCPSFRLPAVDGRTYARDDFASAPVLCVMFICNHCPYVKHLRRELALLTDRWQQRGVAVFGINSNDPDAYPDDAPDRMAEEARTVGYHEDQRVGFVAGARAPLL